MCLRSWNVIKDAILINILTWKIEVLSYSKYIQCCMFWLLRNRFCHDQHNLIKLSRSKTYLYEMSYIKEFVTSLIEMTSRFLHLILGKEGKSSMKTK